jgi:GT2 family glycosyltransferase
MHHPMRTLQHPKWPGILELSMPGVIAIVVLYKVPLAACSSYQTLLAAFESVPAAHNALEIVIADNSPEPQPIPAGFVGQYISDGQNPGLARRYNQALAYARQSGAEWLLLLDQDTVLTPGYVAELIERTAEMQARPEVAIIVPKLEMAGRIISPHPQRFLPAANRPGRPMQGLLAEPAMAFNSGAALRVRALEAIGGFPETYWLDYLDHATMHKLRDAGGRMYVMDAVLQHELSELSQSTPMSPARLKNKLHAELRYYSEYGTRRQQRRVRADILRQSIGHARRGRFKEAAVYLRALLQGATKE